MTTRIRELVSQGYLVISTFQWHESQTFSPTPFVTQMEDFRRMADAGAAVVSGSQAHAPQTMEFYDDAFIHYGLGNLFFDQMGDLTGQPESVRDEFLDLYTIHKGRVISVELRTAKLEDYSRPRPMTELERREFLTEMFTHSGWLSLVPSPSPEPTVTLTPIRIPEAVPTATP
jgi:poly-gamma-glutamate synthesis protein (capsule biosynthesis protein)